MSSKLKHILFFVVVFAQINLLLLQIFYLGFLFGTVFNIVFPIYVSFGGLYFTSLILIKLTVTLTVIYIRIDIVV